MDRDEAIVTILGSIFLAIVCFLGIYFQVLDGISLDTMILLTGSSMP